MGTISELIGIIERSQQQRVLFHFTDDRNLPSIRQKGLLSKEAMERLGIIPAAPGGNQWSHDADRAKGIYGYVSLCFFSDHPMCFKAKEDGRINVVKYLSISPSVLRTPSVLFSSSIANSRESEIKPLEEAISEIDLQVIYRRTDWKLPEIQERRKVAKKYEILVPNEISLQFILRGL